MITRFINKSVSFMIQKGVIVDTEDEREVYAYGMELQVYYVINAALLLAVGFLFGRALEVAFLLFLFGLIQSNGGGYHADTHRRCTSIMVIGVFAFLFLLPLIDTYIFAQTAVVGFGMVAVLCLSPIAHKNHPLNPQMSERMGKRAKIISVVLALIWCVLTFSNTWPSISSVISLAMFFTGVSMFAAWIRKRVFA